MGVEIWLDESCDGGLVASKELDNYFRYYLLLQLAIDAVRIWFDSVIPPQKLQKHLRRYKKKSLRNCSDEQKDILFRARFDITLIYKIIRTTTNLKKPGKGWGQIPDTSNTEPVDDLERVRIHRNTHFHGPPSIKEEVFQGRWAEMSEISQISLHVIKRLGKDRLNGKVDALKTKILDHAIRADLSLQIPALQQQVQDLQKGLEYHVGKYLQLQHGKIIQKWKEEDEVFFRTEIYNSVSNKIRSLGYLTVTGSSGTGKSSLIRHFALKLAEEGFNIIPVSRLDEMILLGNLSSRQVFVVDDVLGVHGSKENHLNDKDKKGMLRLHCEYREVEPKFFKHFELKSTMPMFPLLCNMFSSNDKYQILGEQFFSQPYEYLFSEMDSMRQLKKIHYAALVYCVVKDNCINPKCIDRKCLKDVYDCCRANRSTSNWELIDTLSVLEGSYLMLNSNGSFLFAHDKLFEIVAIHFGRCFPDRLLQHTSSTFIYSYITLSDTKPERSGTNIYISEDQFAILADRVISDIKRFNLYEVFQYDILKHPKFLEVFCDTLKSFSFEELKNLLLRGQRSESSEEKNRVYVEDLMEKGAELLQNTTDVSFQLKLLHLKHVYSAQHWIIAYGHDVLLSSVEEMIDIKLTENKSSPCMNCKRKVSELIYGNNLDSQFLCLVLACFSGSLKMVEIITRSVMKECLNYYPAGKLSPLCAASLCGYNDIVIALLEKGVEVNRCGASHGGHLETVEFLITSGADVNVCTKHGASPLFIASRYGHLETVKYLIKSSADLNLCDKYRLSPISYTSYSGQIETVKSLIKSGAESSLCDEATISALGTASYNGHLDIVKYLMKSGAEANIGLNCISAACYQGHLDVIEYLIDKVDVNKLGERDLSSLHISFLNGHLNVVKYLIKHGADVNFLDQKGHTKIVENLVEHGANVNEGLQIAKQNGHEEIVDYLIQKGAR
ncbi:uncharacterized protein LOC133193025 [Saccostrea echinata]|uniref:uncharacterized protein LOC133193025 n=1 Tax=Saccostrea echinata TaxID=191078 RepID=UPI002A7FBF03|nr:uncharacterized protein LOC133193025 [Saccostrea echinata]